MYSYPHLFYIFSDLSVVFGADESPGKAQAFESTEEPHTPDGQVNGDERRDRCLTLLQIQEKRRHMHFFLSFKFIFILSSLSLYLLFNVSISNAFHT